MTERKETGTYEEPIRDAATNCVRLRAAARYLTQMGARTVRKA